MSGILVHVLTNVINIVTWVKILHAWKVFVDSLVVTCDEIEDIPESESIKEKNGKNC